MRLARSALLAVTALASTLAGPAALAQTPSHVAPVQRDTLDTSLPTQLPREAVPNHYALTLTPDARAMTFTATVAIDLAVTKATRTLTLNALDLAIQSATLSGAGAALAGKPTVDRAAQTVTFDFARTIAPGAYRLTIAYSGKINTQANGLFALNAKDARGADTRSLFTQFEPADARRLFPGWDEPDYKASFDLTAIVPAGEMAVSNMPAAATRPVAGGKKEVRFQTSPSMSSYLLFFASGDFDRVAQKVGNREVGIVMSRGNGAKAQTALAAEAAILPFYNDYFGVDYPLPKLDNVAGPGQSQFFGAMENWGAIFTFERVLLDDPAITTDRERQGIFDTEAHEMAHQWFGDLVTMAWWNDLWLNEGFASWMQNKATRHFHPDWGADVDQVAAREAAMDLDAFATTHPIVQDIRTVEQANQAFDTITYEKGESVIAMMEGFAGADVWRSGIRDYMRTHAYRNTVTADLWAAVEGAGANGLTRIANDFTRQGGVPLISVSDVQCVNGRTSATLRQGQFTVDRQAESNARPVAWHVPVRASAGGATSQAITDGPTTRIDVAGCGPLLLNPGQTGYFRTLYTPAQSDALRAGFAALAAPDQFGVMNNALALSMAGYQPVAPALDLLDAAPVAGNGRVVQSALRNWVGISHLLDEDATAKRALTDRAIARFGPRLAQLGFTPRAGEPPLDASLRPTLIDALGYLGDPRVVAEADRLTQAWLRDRNAIPGSLKSTWLVVAARNATPALWDQLHAAAKATPGNVERTSLYELLGRTRDEALARRALDLALTSEAGETISAGIITAVAREHSALALDFVLSHLPQVNALVDSSGRSRFIGRLVDGSDDAAQIAKLDSYAAANLGAGDRRPIAEATAQIRVAAATKQRVAGPIAEWLTKHR